MKVLMIVQTFSHISGGRYSLYTIARELAKVVDEFHLLVNTIPNYPNINENDVTFIKNTNEKYDLVIGTRSKGIENLEKYKKDNGKIMMYLFETPLEVYGNYKYDSFWEVTKKVCLKSDVVLCNSIPTMLNVKRWIDHKNIEHIPPAIETEIAKKTTPKQKKYGCIMIGNLAQERKNLKDGVIATKTANEVLKIIYVVGKDRIKKIVEKCYKNYEMYYAVSEKEKWRMIKESKALLCPSYFEGFGMPPAEAMYCNINAFTYNIPPMKYNYYFNPYRAKCFDIREYAFMVAKNIDKKCNLKSYIEAFYSIKALRRRLKRICEKYCSQ